MTKEEVRTFLTAEGGATPDEAREIVADINTQVLAAMKKIVTLGGNQRFKLYKPYGRNMKIKVQKLS